MGGIFLLDAGCPVPPKRTNGVDPLGAHHACGNEGTGAQRRWRLQGRSGDAGPSGPASGTSEWRRGGAVSSGAEKEEEEDDGLTYEPHVTFSHPRSICC
jgi:hypothetical protein